MFELKQLRYFIAVAENTTCNISQVAEELHIAQPNLSAEIKTLERNLDVELFDRSNPRRLKLTPAGKAFLEETRLVFTQIEQSINIAQRTSRGELGILRIGFNSLVFNQDIMEIVV